MKPTCEDIDSAGLCIDTTVAIWMDEEDKKVEYLAANHEEKDPTRSRQRGASTLQV